MKAKIFLLKCLSILIMALLACQVSGGSTSIGTDSTQSPLEELSSPTSTEEVSESEISTPTTTPSSTPTEDLRSILAIYSRPVIDIFKMITPTNGWAVTQDQNHLLTTKDGGDTWLEVTPPDLDALSSVYITSGIQPFFLDENIAWFTPNSDGNGRLYHTQDGGVSWRSTPVPFAFARYYFLDIDHGYALVDLGAGAGSQYIALYRTTDSGLSWRMVFTHEPGESKSLRESGLKNGITFRDAEHGWIGGSIPMDDYFYLYYTEDEGVTWIQEMDIASPGIFTGSMLEVGQPVFVNSTSAFLPVRAMAPSGSCFLLIYRSIDSGQTWGYQGAVEDGLAVDFYTVDEGWLVARSNLYHSVDGGVTWLPTATTGIPASELFLKVDFVDSLHGWVMTTPDEMTWDTLKLYRTSDGGDNWQQLLP